MKTKIDKQNLNYKKSYIKIISIFVSITIVLLNVTAVTYAGSQLIVPITGTYLHNATGGAVMNLSEKAVNTTDLMQSDVTVDLNDFVVPSTNGEVYVNVAVVEAGSGDILASNQKSIIGGVFQSPTAHLHPYDGMTGAEYYQLFPTSSASGNNVKVTITGSSGTSYFVSTTFKLFDYTSANTNSNNNTNTNTNTNSNANSNSNSNTNSNTQASQNSSTDISVDGNSIKLANPIGTNDFMAFVSMILDIALKIGIPIATGFFIWAGFQYVLAQGNSAKVTAAHDNLKYVAFGTILFLGAWSITDIIIKTYQSVLGG